VQWPDAIAGRVSEQLHSLNEIEIQLKAWAFDGGSSAGGLLPSVGSASNKNAVAARVNYLIRTLSDSHKELPLRLASLELLLNLSAFHPGPHRGPLPIDNPSLSNYSAEIIRTAKTIFDNRSENSELRSLSLQFLDLADPQNLTDIRRVYAQTYSPKLQFAIERDFVDSSDSLYSSLTPASGPVASIIELAPQNGCIQPPSNRPTFLIRFYSTRAFNDRGAVVITGHTVLKNIKSGQEFVLKNENVRSMGGHYGSLDGVLVFQLDRLSDFPEGVYTLGMEYAHQFNHLPSAGEVRDVPSVGHTITIAILDSPDGKRLSIPPSDKEKKQRNPAAERELADYISAQSPHVPTAPRGDPDLKVIYAVTGLTFPGAGPQHTETFQFTARNFITSQITLSASQLDSCVNCIQSGKSVQFFPNGTLPLIVAADSVHFTDADGFVYGWVFAPGAFSAAGTYTAFNDPPYIVSDVATLTVRVIPGMSPKIRKERSGRCLYLWKCATRATTASRATTP